MIIQYNIFKSEQITSDANHYIDLLNGTSINTDIVIKSDETMHSIQKKYHRVHRII
jgi:hypothetical protein